MAGYDFYWTYAKEDEGEALAWFRFFAREVDRYTLSCDVREEQKTDEDIRILIGVDGPLAPMQALARALPQLSITYARARGKLSRGALHSIGSFVAENHKGAESMSSIFFGIGRSMREAGISMRRFTLAIPPVLEEASRRRSLPRRERESIHQVIQCARRWTTNRVDAGEVLILGDQAAENWLRSKVASPPFGFPDLTKTAVKGRILTASEAARLRRFHESRRRIQHHGKKARNKTASSFVGFLLGTLEKRYAPAHPKGWDKIRPEDLLEELKKATLVNSPFPSPPPDGRSNAGKTGSC